MATFVLCHGGWGGSWQWRTIPDLLRANGHRVFTPTFTGLGERIHLANPDVDLNTYITDVANVILFEELHDVVLVGYSFSGMVITGVADKIPDRISHLVYLDAVVPKDGQSLADLLEPEIKAQVFAAIEHQGDGWKMPHVSSKPSDPRMTPQPSKTGTQPVTLRHPVARSLPRSFIYCTKGKDGMLMEPPIKQAAETAKSDASWQYYELQTDHHPMDNIPQELARLLDTIIAQEES
ncbi:MAG: alpha/beta fold hydrolase [Anaerolineales bacterium]|jgi:pimeloyl-ACP methyl ester carboxylesterase